MNIIRTGFRRINYLLEKKAIVLSYHRVANPILDPWEISVTPANFEEHLQVLRSYRIITPAELQTCLSEGGLKNKMVCITFDDAYQDNYINAKPLLEKYDLQSTIFVPVHFIGQRKEFWWDELQNLIFCDRDLPEHLSISIGQNSFEFNLGEDAKFNHYKYQENKSWRWFEQPNNQRAELYLKLWELLRPLKLQVINEAMENLKTWLSFEIPGDATNFPMTTDELNSVVHHSLFNVGIHTTTHPALIFHSKQEQFKEILQCKQALDEMTGKPISTIAYPYGLYNEDTIAVAEELEIRMGFTTEGRAVNRNDHPLKLARYHVKNCDGNEFERRLRIWIRGF